MGAQTEARFDAPAAAGPDSPAGAAQVYVSDRPRDTLAVVTLCAELALVPGGWAVGSCGLVGRYVTLAIPGPARQLLSQMGDAAAAAGLPLLRLLLGCREGAAGCRRRCWR